MTAETFYEGILTGIKTVSRDEFDIIASRLPVAESVTLVETITGINIPEDFLAFSLRTNGLSILAKETLWPEPEILEVRPAWTFKCGVVILGIETDELPEWASILNSYKELIERFGIKDVLPLLKIYGERGHAWGVRKDGSFVEVCEDEITVLDKSFAQVYSDEVQALVQRLRDMKNWMVECNK